jgi:coenzyme F420-0:L-glutamate ligase/coenzyme F420-1:gamma-L-glutamate ligase
VSLSVFPVAGIGDVHSGDDLAALIVEAIEASDLSIARRDVLVITHKVVSKAEGAVVEGVWTDADYRRLVEREATAVVRRRADLVIAETHHGFVCANAGVDRSNTSPGTAVLLPADPDRSAHRLRQKFEQAFGVDLGVVISDTFGRAWRRGVVDVAIGVSGVEAVVDHRGTTDTYGRVLEATEVALADEIAAAADLVMGKATGIPVAVVRGIKSDGAGGRAADLVRRPEEDLFR